MQNYADTVKNRRVCSAGGWFFFNNSHLIIIIDICLEKTENANDRSDDL